MGWGREWRKVVSLAAAFAPQILSNSKFLVLQKSTHTCIITRQYVIMRKVDYNCKTASSWCG